MTKDGLTLADESSGSDLPPPSRKYRQKDICAQLANASGRNALWGVGTSGGEPTWLP